MEKYINNIIKTFGVSDVIIDESLKINLPKAERCWDIRSGAFNALGKSIISKSNSLLIINGNYLSNIYTALTEAWFQKANLIVIALYPTMYDIETHYLDRCLVENMTFNISDYDNFIEKINESTQVLGPKLYNIITNIQHNHDFNYSSITKEIEKLLAKDDKVTIYSDDFKSDNNNIHVIPSKYKYGAISKYAASIINEKHQHYLVCPADYLLLDLNILNNRYLNPRFKVILCSRSTDDIKYLSEWVTANHISLIISKDFKKDLQNLASTNKPSILITKESK